MLFLSASLQKKVPEKRKRKNEKYISDERMRKDNQIKDTNSK